jgi:DNA-binding SARP family transcriptional activator
MSERGHGSVGGDAETVRIRLLGGFRVSVGDRTVRQDSWRMRKAASLVKLLALAPWHHLHRGQAMETLWPGLGRRAASNNLRQALHAARRALDPDSIVGPRYLASEDESLVLCPEGQLWVDSNAFEEAARNAHRSREPAAYEVALDLYAEDFYRATATKSGLRNTEGGCERPTSRCCWDSRGCMRIGRTTTPQPRCLGGQ